MHYYEIIKSLREDNDLNQTQVANIIHVAQTTYSDYKKAKFACRLNVLSNLPGITTLI